MQVLMDQLSWCSGREEDERLEGKREGGKGLGI